MSYKWLLFPQWGGIQESELGTVGAVAVQGQKVPVLIVRTTPRRHKRVVASHSEEGSSYLSSNMNIIEMGSKALTICS